MITVDPALFETSPYVILPTDRKPDGKLAHIRLVSQGWGHQIHEWVDEAGQLWHIGPGYREWVGTDPHPVRD